MSYTHKEVTAVCELPPRRVIHWTQTGLVEASVEASGAGSKREYSYTNLLEFGLCKELFDMGLGVQAVKKILKELREDGDLQAWANNFDDYYNRIADEFRTWFTSKQRAIPAPPKLTGDNPFLWFNTDHIKKRLADGRNVGVLFYCYKKGERIKLILPLRMKEALEAVYSYKDIYTSLKINIVDIGTIKVWIDHNIMLKI